MNTHRMECATTQNVSWRLPKHLRSWSSSTGVQRSRTKRLVQPCACRASQTNNRVHDLTRTCTLQSTSKAHRLPARIMAAASPRLSCHTTRALALPCTQQPTKAHINDGKDICSSQARLLRWLRALARLTTARHPSGPVHHVGAFRTLPIDTQRHHAQHVVSSSRQRPGLNLMPQRSPAQAPHRRSSRWSSRAPSAPPGSRPSRFFSKISSHHVQTAVDLCAHGSRGEKGGK